MSKSIRASACAAALFLFGAYAAEASFSFSDIHFWVGSGTNRCALVLDWANGSENSSIAWGCRWNGDSIVALDVIQRVIAADPRLHAALSDGGWGLSIDGFGYDLGDIGAAFASACTVSTSADAFINLFGTYYWAQSIAAGESIDENSDWESCAMGIASQQVTNNCWFGATLTDWTTIVDWTAAIRPGECVAAESPFAFEVVASATGSASAGYIDPNNVLGRPTTYTAPDSAWGGIVTPCVASWGAGELYSIDVVDVYDDDSIEPGYITVKFDHPVMDDVCNPYGLDFIVFGNSFLGVNGGVWVDNTTDPGTVTVNADDKAERGIVEVSQDGTNWFTYADGPFADDFAPTLGYCYDTNTPDASLFAGNLWWGAETSPTTPVDPAMTLSGVSGMTLADVCRAYGKSAGGTGFDIGQFDLPVDGSGRKWIQYVRVKNLDTETPDIDAFADVAPESSGYARWARENFSWMDMINEEAVAPYAIAENGRPNYFNALMGAAPGSDAPDFRIESFDNGVIRFTEPSNANIAMEVSATIQSVTNLVSAKWKNVATVPCIGNSVDVSESIGAGTNGFFRVKLTHDPQ